MLFVWFIAVYIACCISIISIFLFGQLDFCRASPLGLANRFLVESTPRFIRSRSEVMYQRGCAYYVSKILYLPFTLESIRHDG